MADIKVWKDVAASLEKLLRLRTFPIGIKLYEETMPLDKIEGLRTPVRKTLPCQLITLARTVGWTIGLTLEGLLSGSPCAAMLGFDKRREIITEGTYRGSIWFDSAEEGRKCEQTFPHLSAGKYKAMVLGPIKRHKFEPDIVLIYGTPAQMILVVNALQWKDYERLRFFCMGESSCADYIAECYLSSKPALTIPCFGERVYGHAQEDELVIAIPANQMEKLLEGLQGLSKRGVRYPIPYAGIQLDVVTKLPPLYLNIYGIEHEPLFVLWNKRESTSKEV
jgi:uncharacterized protein (DUF169 family)